MAIDALSVLRQEGNPVDLLTERQQAVLISIRERLDAVSDSEVEGHANVKIV